MRETIGSADASSREILQADQARLQRSLDTLEQAQRVADTTHPEVIIKSNRADQGSRAIFGTDTSQPQFSLNVTDNEAGLGAVVSAGVHTPQTLQALLRDSRTPDLALALQALQTQPQNTNAPVLRSVLHNLSVGPSEATHSTNPRISEGTNPVAFSALRQSIEPLHEEVVKNDKALR